MSWVERGAATPSGLEHMAPQRLPDFGPARVPVGAGQDGVVQESSTHPLTGNRGQGRWWRHGAPRHRPWRPPGIYSRPVELTRAGSDLTACGRFLDSAGSPPSRPGLG
jgi:hypothetical protein